MQSCLVLVAPSANHVYANQAPRLAAAELALCCPQVRGAEPIVLAGVEYIALEIDDAEQPLDPATLRAVSRASATLAAFQREGELLRPIELPATHVLDEDLVTIPKYRGKTNEQFTRLLLNVTLAGLSGAAAARRDQGVRLAILDPMAGRGTTLQEAWLAGHNGYGVELDVKAVEALAAHMTTWLRHKRLKHTSRTHPVRRDGRVLGKKYEAELRLPSSEPLEMGVFTGDTRDSAKLWGRRKFDAVVVDAPYGVVHAATSRPAAKGPDAKGGGKGTTADKRHGGRDGRSSGRDRSPAQLLSESISVWASQLRSGGAMGISWNTFGLAREDLLAMMADAGLQPLDDDLHRGLDHRVDSSIHRDVAVAVKATA